ncbi:solute carrier family 52, riboflavin transporter, member 3-A-like [Tachypleus tridentatus]|uniref:solute carrier family 52, riboflavin transporter, member 3-A-like n=1 Tax=Tachypleus tridentatus TaxID=6853 RepID=UPI003FD45439
MALTKCFSTRRLLVDILVILFGISSWIEINGLWVELPLLVSELPEKWTLGSYIVVITQVANLGPITYSLLRKFFVLKTLEKPTIHITLSIGTISCLLLALFWSKTTLIGGEEHSTVMLSLAFSLALVDCTSSVLYLPFMAHLHQKYLTTYLIGEGMSGLLPSVVALIQGIGGNPQCRNNTVSNFMTEQNTTIYEVKPYYPPPRFSVEIFFIFLCIMMVMSWFAFLLLDKLPSVKAEQVPIPEVQRNPSNGKERANSTNLILEPDHVLSLGINPKDRSTITQENQEPNDNTETQVEKETNEYLLKKNDQKLAFVVFLWMQGFISSLTNGILPAVQSFSCLPYGNAAFHLSVTLSSIANPSACFIAMFKSLRSMTNIVILTIFGTVCAGYILMTAILSPTPPLVDETIGRFFIVLIWILFVGTMSYVKACIAGNLRAQGGQKALFLCGVCTQIGSSLGAILMFFLVNYGDIFQSYLPCT